MQIENAPDEKQYIIKPGSDITEMLQVEYLGKYLTIIYYTMYYLVFLIYTSTYSLLIHLFNY